MSISWSHVRINHPLQHQAHCPSWWITRRGLPRYSISLTPSCFLDFNYTRKIYAPENCVPLTIKTKITELKQFLKCFTSRRSQNITYKMYEMHRCRQNILQINTSGKYKRKISILDTSTVLSSFLTLLIKDDLRDVPNFDCANICRYASLLITKYR